VTAREADSLKKGFTKDHCLSCVEVVDGEEFTKSRVIPVLAQGFKEVPFCDACEAFLLKELLIFTEAYPSISVLIH
jgi:NAD-dependent SIR2 family protein deacetylase